MHVHARAHTRVQDTICVLARKEIKVSTLIANIERGQQQQQAGATTTTAASSTAHTISWRLDKDEPASGFTQMRSNLVQLMSADRPLAGRLRALVVDLEAPARQLNPVAQQVG